VTLSSSKVKGGESLIPGVAEGSLMDSPTAVGPDFKSSISTLEDSLPFGVSGAELYSSSYVVPFSFLAKGFSSSYLRLSARANLDLLGLLAVRSLFTSVSYGLNEKTLSVSSPVPVLSFLAGGSSNSFEN